MSPGRGEEGMTLIELLVAMTLGVVVLFATLSAFDTFGTSSTRQINVVDSNGVVRSAMDRVVTDLRQSATIINAGANDLTYSVADSSTTNRGERLCLASTGIIYSAQITTTAAVTYPGPACPTTASGWTSARISPTVSSNSTSNPLFVYDSATLATIKNVALTFLLTPSAAGPTHTTSLRASATVRKAAGTLDVGNNDVTVTCTNSGPLVSLSATAANSLGSGLNVAYTTTGGVALGSGTSAVQLSSSVTAIVATLTTSSGSSGSITKQVDCTPTSTS